MQDMLTEKLEEVVRLRRQKPEQIIAQAVEIGLDRMWVDTVLGQYLKKQIPRRKAIRLVGLELVALAEHQNRAVQEDLKWS